MYSQAVYSSAVHCRKTGDKETRYRDRIQVGRRYRDNIQGQDTGRQEVQREDTGRQEIERQDTETGYRKAEDT